MKRSSILLAVLSLFLTATSFAQATPVWIEPSAPTSTTPITIHAAFTCIAVDPSVTVNGSAIRARFLVEGCPSGAPVNEDFSVALPSLLAPGEYFLDVEFGNEVVGSLKFVVRDGAPKPFVVHPFAVPTGLHGSPRLRLSGDGPICNTGICTVRVGGVAVEKTFDGEAIWFDAPPHAPGLVDIEVEQGDVLRRSPAALYYFSPNQTPDVSVFERILFPVLLDAVGVGGSHWVSDAVVSNPRPWSVWNYNSIFPFVCLAYPCGEQLSRGQTVRFSGSGYPHGTALLVPREEANGLAFSLRARDISHDEDGFGTEIPVVREANMFRGTMTLLNVPLDPRFRAKLRVYGFAEGSAGYGPYTEIAIRRVGGAPPRTDGTLPGDQCPTCIAGPYYKEFDLPAGATDEISDVYVSLHHGYRGWAFVSVTNNLTQQVTIVTPSGTGGFPCTEDCTPP